MGPLAFVGPVLRIVTSILGGDFVGGVKSLLKDVADGKVSVAEAEAQVDVAWADAKARMTEALSESAADVFGEAQKTIQASFQSDDPMVRRAWAFVVWSQTLVLLWYQIGIPVYVKMFGGGFPRTGDDLLQWAYALVGGALGLGLMGSAKQAISGAMRGRR